MTRGTEQSYLGVIRIATLTWAFFVLVHNIQYGDAIVRHHDDKRLRVQSESGYSSLVRFAETKTRSEPASAECVNDCGICHENMNDEPTMFLHIGKTSDGTSSIGHEFHVSCLLDFCSFSPQLRCPICREETPHCKMELHDAIVSFLGLNDHAILPLPGPNKFVRGTTLLHIVAQYGNAFAIDKLAEKKASSKPEAPKLPVDIADDNGENPIHRAVARGDSNQALDHFLKPGMLDTATLMRALASPNKVGLTPLHLAADKQKNEAIYSILTRIAQHEKDFVDLVVQISDDDDRDTMLHILAVTKNNQGIEMFLKFVPRATLLLALAIQDAYGFNPLHHLARLDNRDVMMLVLEHFKDSPTDLTDALNQKTEKHRLSVLDCVTDSVMSVEGKASLIERLLTYGAKIGTNVDLWLGAAIDANRPDWAQMAFESPRGIAYDILSFPLPRILRFSRLKEWLQILFDHGFTVDTNLNVVYGVKSPWTSTLLQFAIERNDDPLVTFLIEEGADPTIVTSHEGFSMSPLVHACGLGRDIEMIRKLIHIRTLKEPFVNDNHWLPPLLGQLATSGTTPLMAAARWCSIETVELLLRSNALQTRTDVWSTNEMSQNVLHLACMAATNVRERIARIKAKVSELNPDWAKHLVTGGDGAREGSPLLFAIDAGRADAALSLIQEFGVPRRYRGSALLARVVRNARFKVTDIQDCVDLIDKLLRTDGISNSINELDLVHVDDIDLQQTPLFQAVDPSIGTSDIGIESALVHILLENNADPNVECEINSGEGKVIRRVLDLVNEHDQTLGILRQMLVDSGAEKTPQPLTLLGQISGHLKRKFSEATGRGAGV